MKKYFWTFYTFVHQDIETLNEMTNVLQNTFTNAYFFISITPHHIPKGPQDTKSEFLQVTRG